jgi:hypothetical protein
VHALQSTVNLAVYTLWELGDELKGTSHKQLTDYNIFRKTSQLAGFVLGGS